MDDASFEIIIRADIADPVEVLRARLGELAGTLGPLPHAQLNIERGRDNKGPADRPKKRGTRMLKATCRHDSCAFVVRVAARPVREIGPLHCPRHGEMLIEWPEDEEPETISAGEDLRAAAG